MCTNNISADKLLPLILERADVTDDPIEKSLLIQCHSVISNQEYYIQHLQSLYERDLYKTGELYQKVEKCYKDTLSNILDKMNTSDSSELVDYIFYLYNKKLPLEEEE